MQMRETMVANKPPPVPPPGTDPALLDVMKQALNDIKQMREDFQVKI
jgi:hypothetical protein